MVGGGLQEDNLKAQVNNLNLQGNVIFTGRVPHSDIQRYYNMVDIFIYPRLPIRLTELVTPLKPLEAMAQGRLVVASDVGGHKELIKDNETGLLFKAGSTSDLANTVNHLISNYDQWPKYKTSARQFVETERNWPKSVGYYHDIYKNF